MNGKANMLPVLPPSARTSQGQVVDRQLSKLEERRARDERNREDDRLVAGWLDSAVKAYGKADALAAELDTDPGYFSKMRSGEKPAPLRVLAKFKGNAPAAKAFSAGLLDTVSMTVVPLVTELRLEPGQAQVLRHLRVALGGMWAPYRDMLAAQVFACRGELIDVALDLDAMVGK